MCPLTPLPQVITSETPNTTRQFLETETTHDDWNRPFKEQEFERDLNARRLHRRGRRGSTAGDATTHPPTHTHTHTHTHTRAPHTHTHTRTVTRTCHCHLQELTPQNCDQNTNGTATHMIPAPMPAFAYVPYTRDVIDKQTPIKLDGRQDHHNSEHHQDRHHSRPGYRHRKHVAFEDDDWHRTSSSH
jgi:hypothetical protein